MKNTWATGVERLNDRRVLVLGAGISGASAARVLQSLGAAVVVSDVKSREQLGTTAAALAQAGIPLWLGEQSPQQLAGMTLVVLSPGVSMFHPLAVAARRQGIPVISEVELAYHLTAAPIIAVTGTNGKTTTTTLLGEMFKRGGYNVVVGGNIGAALSQHVLDLPTAGVVVAEISSFQLEAVREFKPHIAVILNITPDHLDRHYTLANYRATKEKVFANQQADDFLILNAADPAVRTMADLASSQVLFFSAHAELPEGIFVHDGQLTLRWQGREVAIAPVDSMKIKGRHNIENALAASAAAYLAGVPVAALAQTLAEFPGVEHRIEPVATIDGVDYYNDSKATNPESAIKALEAFPGKIILIAGGHDKHTDLTEFMRLVRQRVEQLILLGEAAERFAQAARQAGVANIYRVSSLAEAVALAHRLGRPGNVVLLSPACSSYDMFTNFEERGRVFKALIAKLQGV